MDEKLHIDPEFRSLIPPLSDEERELLVTSIKTEGCRDALVIWSGHNILIDGHNRYDICQVNNIPYQTVERSFDSREDVIVWIIRNQFGRRNISSFVRSELALKLKGTIEIRARLNQATSTGGSYPQLLENFPKAEAINTREEIAHLAEVSDRTIGKVETVIKSAPESIKAAARRGDISTHQAYEITKALENAPESIKDKVSQLAQDGSTPTPVQVKSFIKEYKRLEKEQAKAAIPDTLPPALLVQASFVNPWKARTDQPMPNNDLVLKATTALHNPTLFPKSAGGNGNVSSRQSRTSSAWLHYSRTAQDAAYAPHLSQPGWHYL